MVDQNRESNCNQLLDKNNSQSLIKQQEQEQESLYILTKRETLRKQSIVFASSLLSIVLLYFLLLRIPARADFVSSDLCLLVSNILRIVASVLAFIVFLSISCT